MTEDGHKTADSEAISKLSVAEERGAREKAVAEELAKAFELKEFLWFRNQAEFTVEASRLVALATDLKTDERFQFIQLTDVSAVDYLKLEGDYPERFALIYGLFSFFLKTRIRLKVWIDEDSPSAPTLCGVYGSANWGEREVFDMFGIEFDGHPNLSRILMPTDFGSHPLRKDYPLRGRGERDDFPRMRRGGKHDL